MIEDPIARLAEVQQRLIAFELILVSLIGSLALGQGDAIQAIKAMKSDVLRNIAAAEREAPAGEGMRDVVGNSHKFAALFFDDLTKHVTARLASGRGPST